MTVDVRLLDIVALVPQQDPGIPELPYLSSVGEATLVIEIHDSQSGKIRYRAVERRAARRSVGGVQSSRISGWAEIWPAARLWASVIRTQLDRIYDMA